MLHVSDISWTKKINHPSEMVKVGDVVRAVVLSVDPDKKRVALGLKQLSEDPWKHAIPRRFSVGDCLDGVVTKSTKFGVFVELEDELEGLLHISELGPNKVNNPEQVVKVEDKVQVRILKVDPEERKIGLTLITVNGRDPAELVQELEAQAQAEGASESAEAAEEGDAATATTEVAEPAAEAVAEETEEEAPKSAEGE